jgi:uncharacterized protein involved in exopolysaccharide biosynthesis
MEIREVFDRIVRVHWKLILLLLVAGLTAGFTIHADDRASYTAAARVILDTPDPTSDTEAQAIADTARAIVTSPSLVERALEKSGLHRSVSQLADDGIVVETIGSSGILEIAVTDRDPAAAAELANLMAQDLILTRLRTSTGPLEEGLSRIEQRIAQLETSLEVLNAGIAAAPDLETEIRLSREKDLLVQRLVILEQKRADLLSTQAQRPTPQIIDPAQPPHERDPSRQPADMALGGLIGLALGISLIAIWESVRPTLVGGPAVARELKAPILGFLPTTPDRSNVDDLGPVTAWVSASAKNAGVRTVGLVSARRGQELDHLAAGLREHLNGEGSIGIRPVEPEWVKGAPRGAVATPTSVVVVTPVRIPKSDLAGVRDLSRAMGGKVLGAIAYREPRLRLRRRQRVNNG